MAICRRAGWVPINDTKIKNCFNIAGNFSFGKPLDDTFSSGRGLNQILLPQLINTGRFPASRSTSIGAEIYYGNGSFMIGSEIMQHKFYSNKTDDTYI
jgi:hypothetical protein